MEVTPAAMREVLGTFSTGVVVVTGLDPAASGPVPVGFTCQSFASLSLQPPLVSFSPARTSTSWPRIRRAGSFCVNILAHDQRALSERFARVDPAKFDGVPWTPSPLGSPVIEGVSAWVDCELYAEHDGGDHTIVVGSVRALGADPQRHPLIFYRGRYAPSEHWLAWPEL